MHAATYAVTQFTAATIGGRAAQRTIRRRRCSHVVARADSQRDALVSPTTPSSSRRGTLLAGIAGVVVGAGAPPRAHAVEPPTTPDASSSAYIQGLLANTEANKDRCVTLFSATPPDLIPTPQAPTTDTIYLCFFTPSVKNSPLYSLEDISDGSAPLDEHRTGARAPLQHGRETVT